MTELEQAIFLLEQHLGGSHASVAMVHETDPGESSMYATTTGYVSLACALLKLVVDVQNDQLPVNSHGVFWDDGLNKACMRLPVDTSTWIVGAYVCPSNERLLAELQSLIGDQLPVGSSLPNDPDLHEPDVAD